MKNYFKILTVIGLLLSVSVHAQGIIPHPGGAINWKQSVANAGALPMSGNTDGDARITLNDQSIYVWQAAGPAWIQAATPAVTSSITALNTDVVAVGPGAVSATIQPNVVTNNKLAQMAAHTFKGNNTAGLTNALDLSVSQVKTDLSLNNVDNTSDANKPVSTAGAAADAAVQAFSIQRANHTGTQLSSTISDFAASARSTVVASSIVDGDLTHSPDGNSVFDALALKQDALGFTPEDVSNKSTDGTFAANSDTLYPSQKAAKTYADTKLSSVPMAQVVFVNKSGVDATCAIGRVDLPCLTIAQAESLITDGAANKRYAIQMGAGTFTEGTLVLKPFIGIQCIAGGGHPDGSTHIQGTVVSLNATQGAGSIIALNGCYFGSASSFAIDYSATNASGTHFFSLSNSYITGAVSLVGKSTSSDFFITNSQFNSTTTLQSGLFVTMNNHHQGNLTINNGSTPVNTQAYLNNARIWGNLSISNTTAFTTSVHSVNSDVGFGTVTIDGSGTTLRTGAESLGIGTAAPSILNGATLVRASQSFGTGFVPAVSGNWSSVPTNVRDALDTLAATKTSTVLTSAHVLVGNGSNVAADVAMSGAIAIDNVGATSYVGTVPINKGGSGQVTQQAAINALAGAVTVNTFLRGDGTNDTMSLIQLGDLPNAGLSNISSDTTGASAIKFYYGDTSGAGFNFTLPAASSNSGVEFNVFNTDFGGANAISVLVTGGDVINGGSSDSIGVGENRRYVSNGTSWFVHD